APIPLTLRPELDGHPSQSSRDGRQGRRLLRILRRTRLALAERLFHPLGDLGEEPLPYGQHGDVPKDHEAADHDNEDEREPHESVCHIGAGAAQQYTTSWDTEHRREQEKSLLAVPCP